MSSRPTSALRFGRAHAATLVAALAFFALPGGVGAGERSVFDLARQSDTVLAGEVVGASESTDGKLRVFRIRVTEPLKGGAVAGETVTLVQEVFSTSTRPFFETGEQTLVFALPLQKYSSYAKVLPPGDHLRWAERLPTTGDMRGLGDPALVTAVRDYLAAGDDTEAAVRVLARALVGPQPRLRRDVLLEVAARPELAPLFDAAALAPLPAFLADDRVPLADRAQILVALARAGAPGVGPIAESIQTSVPGLRPAALDALVSLGRAPKEATLLEASNADDPALRIAAARGLAQNGGKAALARLAAMVTGDPSPEVIRGVLEALGGLQTPAAAAAVEPALGNADRKIVKAATDALARMSSAASVQVLAKALAHGSFEAQTLAAFALAQANRDDARQILHEQESAHPDPRIQKTCRIALGESAHEH